MNEKEVNIKRAWFLLELDVPDLQERGGIAMKFVVESDSETQLVFVPQPEAINSNDAKVEIAERVQAIVREIGAHTVFHISDAWLSTIKDAHRRPELMAHIQ